MKYRTSFDKLEERIIRDNNLYRSLLYNDNKNIIPNKAAVKRYIGSIDIAMSYIKDSEVDPEFKTILRRMLSNTTADNSKIRNMMRFLGIKNINVKNFENNIYAALEEIKTETNSRYVFAMKKSLENAFKDEEVLKNCIFNYNKNTPKKALTQKKSISRKKHNDPIPDIDPSIQAAIVELYPNHTRKQIIQMYGLDERSLNKFLETNKVKKYKSKKESMNQFVSMNMKGLTPGEIARRTGYSVSYVYQLLNESKKLNNNLMAYVNRKYEFSIADIKEDIALAKVVRMNTAYKMAVENGYIGTKEDFSDEFSDLVFKSGFTIINDSFDFILNIIATNITEGISKFVGLRYEFSY